MNDHISYAPEAEDVPGGRRQDNSYTSETAEGVPGSRRQDNHKKIYLSGRIRLCAGIGLGLLVTMLGYLWLVILNRGQGMVMGSVLTLALAGYLFLVYRLVMVPYRETRKIYEQFVLGYVLEDLFAARYPLTPETDQAVRRLNEMIDRDNLISVSKKQAEYLALQNQINPHFLYNTLEGIRSEALIAGLDSVAEMTEALATFFRYTISRVEHLVTLEDELANIENYYYIQQFRFGDKLALSIEYDHDDDDFNELDILQYCLPKLTLQPIVENSIYHGIERKIGKGHLVIRIGVSDERMRIRVSDDGLGMSEDKLRTLNERLRSLNMEDEEEPGPTTGPMSRPTTSSIPGQLTGPMSGEATGSMPGQAIGPMPRQPSSARNSTEEKPVSEILPNPGSRPAHKGGIAIVNVNNRIKLLFGEEYGISVYSHEGSGTDVLITLPLKRV